MSPSRQLVRVEEIVNSIIQEKLTVHAQVTPLGDASKINGLRAVNGERYPDPVRVLSIGADVGKMLEDPDNAVWKKHSVEFCGGTHLTNTNDAELFAVMEETGVAKGIRRITAVTRGKAKEALDAGAAFDAKVAGVEALTGPAELDAAIKTSVQALNEAEIPAPLKAQLRDRLAVVTNKVGQRSGEDKEGEEQESATSGDVCRHFVV